MKVFSIDSATGCGNLVCLGSESLSLLTSLYKKLALSNEDIPSGDYDEPFFKKLKHSESELEAKNSYFVEKPGWLDIQVLASGWKYEWFQITEVKGDEVNYLQFISGSEPPNSINSALDFLCRASSHSSREKIELNKKFYGFVKTNEKIKKVERSGRVLLTSSGKIYFCSGVSGCSTEDSKYNLLATFTKDIACTQDKIVYIDSKGRLFELDLHGKRESEDSISSSTQLRAFETKELICSDRKYDHKISFEKIEAGTSHFIVLTTQGEIHCWGSSRFGETGHGDLLECPIPKRNMALAGIPIKDISCGGFHSAALSEAGDVYTFGLNKYGQLGRSSEAAARSFGQPELINFKLSSGVDPDIVQIRCGKYHTLILDVEGQVWGAGSNESEQLLRHTNVYRFSQPLYQVDFNKEKRISTFVPIVTHIKGHFDGLNTVYLGAGYSSSFIGFQKSH